jgi:hypothetical protein
MQQAAAKTLHTTPGPPTEVSASPEPEGAVVNWGPPSSDGGKPITKYTVLATDKTDPARGGQTATTDGSEGQTVLGLTIGDHYTFTVTATNSIGTGPSSAPSDPVVPTSPPPPPGINCQHVTGSTRDAVVLSSCHSDRQAAGQGTMSGKLLVGSGVPGVISWTWWKSTYSTKIVITTTPDSSTGGYCAREGFGTLSIVRGKVTATTDPDTAVGQSVYGTLCISPSGVVRQSHYGYLSF